MDTTPRTTSTDLHPTLAEGAPKIAGPRAFLWRVPPGGRSRLLDGLRRLGPEGRAYFLIGWISEAIREDRPFTDAEMVADVRDAIAAYRRAEREAGTIVPSSTDRRHRDGT